MSDSRGFAIFGLLAVGAILSVLLGVVLYTTVLNQPKNSNAQRRADVNILLSAVERYMHNNAGSLPEGVTQTPRLITSTPGPHSVNLCQALAPYIKTIPIDPIGGLIVPNDATCQAEGVRYNSGYTIQVLADKHITIMAPSAEGGEQIFASN